MGSDWDFSKYVGSQPVGGGKRQTKAKSRRQSSNRASEPRTVGSESPSVRSKAAAAPTPPVSARSAGVASSRSIDERAVVKQPTENSTPRKVVPAPDPVESSSIETSGQREQILDQMGANWSMESEFYQSREEVLVRLNHSTEFLDALEGTIEARLDQVRTRREEIDGAIRAVAAIEEERWNAETMDEELRRAMRVISDARMEWRRCCLQWPELRGENAVGSAARLSDANGEPTTLPPLTSPNMAYLCKLGFAFTWPLGLAVVVVGVIFLLSR